MMAPHLLEGFICLATMYLALDDGKFDTGAEVVDLNTVHARAEEAQSILAIVGGVLDIGFYVELRVGRLSTKGQVLQNE